MSMTLPTANDTKAILGDEVIVWSKPGCVQCVATERSLEQRGIDHRVFDLTENPEKLEELRASGNLQAPVVEFGDSTWTGFRPDKISEIATTLGLEG